MKVNWYPNDRILADIARAPINQHSYEDIDWHSPLGRLDPLVLHSAHLGRRKNQSFHLFKGQTEANSCTWAESRVATLGLCLLALAARSWWWCSRPFEALPDSAAAWVCASCPHTPCAPLTPVFQWLSQPPSVIILIAMSNHHCDSCNRCYLVVELFWLLAVYKASFSSFNKKNQETFMKGIYPS